MPENTCVKTQGFGDNAVSAYKGLGLKGHPGSDIVCGYGSKIEWPLIAGRSWVYKVIDGKRPANDGTGYYALFAIWEVNGEYFEVSVGHCSSFSIDVGAELKTGQIVGREGNRGLVFVGNVQITKEMQDNGSTAGTHRHWQKRKIMRTKSIEENGVYLMSYSTTGPTRYQDKQGYHYFTPMDIYRNGYNGCVDIQPDLDLYDKFRVKTEGPTVPVKSPELTEKQQIYFLAKIAEIAKGILELFISKKK